jgi:hypothetical protein
MGTGGVQAIGPVSGYLFLGRVWFWGADANRWDEMRWDEGATTKWVETRRGKRKIETLLLVSPTRGRIWIRVI